MLIDEEYKVELLKKLPKYHRKIYEFQQITGAQTPELELLLIAVDFVLDSWFIETATEYGIARLEKIAGLTPTEGETLDSRRFRLLAKYTEKVPYTDETLEERLASLCGSGNYTIVRDYIHYKISIDTTLGVEGAFDDMCKALANMLPCNLVVTLTNTLKAQKSTLSYVGVGLSRAFHYIITNDVNEDLSIMMPLNKAIGVGSASTHKVTNDIRVTDVSLDAENVATPMSVTTVLTIN